jgi:hypothetical protein
MTTSRRPLALLSVSVALAALLAGPAAPARAGTYTVLSCKDRAWAPIASDDAAGGWRRGSTGGPGLDALDDCADPSHGLQATVSGTWAHPVGSQAWWRFVAPPGTLVEGADILYAGVTRAYDGQNRGAINLLGAQSATLMAQLGAGSAPPQWLSRRGLHDAWLQATAQCDGATGSADCQGGVVHATIDVLRSEVLLGDGSPPTAGAASGSAVAAATWQGTETFAFAAADQGAGVYQAILEVDGARVLARTVDDGDGRCVDTTAGAHVFTHPRPCPAAADALVSFDAGALPAGEHDVALRLSDAAGNLRTVYAARKTIGAPAPAIAPAAPTVPARGAANGDNPADAAVLVARWARTSRSRLTTRYGVRSVIRGRLTDGAGAGVRNARIELLTTIDGRAGRALDKGGARTRADGRFTLILPRDVSSRTLLLRYRSHAADAIAAAQATLRLAVRAGVALATGSHVAARGHAIGLSGRLLGRPLPRAGKLVELQARRPGRAWTSVRIVGASPDGRFRAHIALAPGGRYELRARVRAGGDYPYATGASRPVRVRVH